MHRIALCSAIRRTLFGVFAAATFALPVWASRSTDLQEQISALADKAHEHEMQADQAAKSGDSASACSHWRQAADAWREAASAGTSLIVETLNDGSLDPDSVNENVHIMANNAESDDQSAEAVCH